MSRIGEKDNRIVVVYDEEREVREGSNFVLKIVYEVEAGPKFGYLCEVVFFTGESLGYVSRYHIYVATVMCFVCQCKNLVSQLHGDVLFFSRW